ncbi:MAG: TolC family protein, partial [Bacteroidota bacterium]
MFPSYKSMIFRVLFTALLAAFFAGKPVAQVIDYNQIVPPEGQRPANFEDYLVQLAWLNNPETKILELEKLQEEKEVSLQKSAWTDDVGLTFNMNEVSLANVLDDTKEDNLVLYPLYQFTATMKLGSFVNNRKKREIEAVDVQIAEMEGNRHKLRIRAETLARYQTLLLAVETLKVRT